MNKNLVDCKYDPHFCSHSHPNKDLGEGKDIDVFVLFYQLAKNPRKSTQATIELLDEKENLKDRLIRKDEDDFIQTSPGESEFQCIAEELPFFVSEIK